jgi:hypothetical protein
MKRTTMTGLLIIGTMLAAPVFAADGDLCTTNLQKIKDDQTVSAASDPAQGKEMQKSINAAMASHKAGKEKDCIAQTSLILQQIENTKKGGAAGK